MGALVSFCSKWSLDLTSLLPLPSREGFHDFLQFQFPYHFVLGSLKGSCSTFLQQVASSYQIRLTAPLSISQKMSLSLQDVSAPSPAGAKINELSSMTTYSVPKISFCPSSVEMNSEKTLDLPLMAYVSVCGRRTPVMTAFISIFGFRYGIIVTVTVTCCR